MTGIETLLTGAAKAMKAGEALNLANMAGKALGMGGKKEEAGAGGSQGPDKSIEANRAGGRDEEIYLFLDALVGQLQVTDLTTEITNEERRLFGKFLRALTPAEANLVIGGVAKRESDVHIKDPVVLKVRRRNKQGEEREVDETSVRDFTIKTNARGRSIVRGVAHHIAEEVKASEATTEEAIAAAEDKSVADLIALLRHIQLVRNRENVLSDADETMQVGEHALHHFLAKLIVGGAAYKVIMQDPEVVAQAAAIENCTEQSDRIKLREKYQRLLIDKVIAAKEKSREAAKSETPPEPPDVVLVPHEATLWEGIGDFLARVKTVVTFNRFVFIGMPIIIIAFLIFIGTR